MFKILKGLMDKLKGQGADYADVRFHAEDREEHISSFNGEINNFSDSYKSGFGIRVRFQGAWGFASGESVNELDEVALLALENAKYASVLTGEDCTPLEKADSKDLFVTPCEIDPFSVSPAEKVARLLELDGRFEDEKINRRSVSVSFYRKHVFYVNSEGAEIEKKLVDVFGRQEIYALDVDGRQQRRSYSLYQNADGTTGWENILSEEQFGQCERLKRELLELIEAPICPEMVCDVILLPEMMALQTHETIGHALELDRILGYELSFAGGSHVKLDDFGKLEFGSEKLNAAANGGMVNSPGSNGYDDEGVPMHNEVLIENGVLQGAISSRWTVVEANYRAGKQIFNGSGGASRAQSYNRFQIERMNNINVLPGVDGSFEDIVAATTDGIVFESPRSWSIGSNRENFHFACEVGWRVKDGKITGMVRNATYNGPSLPFWHALDMVGDKAQLQQVFNCGKAQPNQIMRLGHSVPICRFSKIQVGV